MIVIDQPVLRRTNARVRITRGSNSLIIILQNPCDVGILKKRSQGQLRKTVNSLETTSDQKIHCSSEVCLFNYPTGKDGVELVL